MTVSEILAEMRMWAGPSDEEIAHSAADRLLVELARTLARGTEHEAMVEEVAHLFAEMPKWYA